MGREKKPGKRTRTTAFGSSGRKSHDASRFYESRMYEDTGGGKPKKNGAKPDNPVPPDVLNRIFTQSSELMSPLPDNSVHLMITSPPYNVKKEYDRDLTLDEYREFLRTVLAETWRVLVDGGRACINVANLGRKPYIPIHSIIIEEMTALGFGMRGEIIWNKGGTAANSTAWGSWCSATNPTLRDIHEYILVFSKGNYARKKPEGKENTIEREEFLEWTKSLWNFPTVKAKKIGHPAPFPEELPHRLIRLYSFTHDVILDPFCGSGTVCVAAQKNHRYFVGFEIEPEYVQLAEKRLHADGDTLNPRISIPSYV